jgi:hypothetical protein
VIEVGRGPAAALKHGEREELVELQGESQRLRMECEIVKKRGPSSPCRVNEIRFYRNGEGPLSGGIAVPRVCKSHVPSLSVAATAGGTAHPPGPKRGTRDRVIFAESRGRYSSTRVHARLWTRGLQTGAIA